MVKFFVILLTVVAFVSGWFVKDFLGEEKLSEVSETAEADRLNFQRYTIENLSKSNIEPGKIKILETLNKEEKFIEYLFELEFKPDPTKNELKKTTGQINIPKGNGPFPLIVMLRGYIDQKKFTTGDGTRNASRVFAENGFITIAPDFLGYGKSDKEAENIFETRFQTYTTVLSLIKSLEESQSNPRLITFKNNLTNKPFNYSTIFLWGHSNGGHIAITILEITGKNYPTTLWAPVTKPFPYSVLYYTDKSVDEGKLVRHELAKFEETNDVNLFSLTNYLNKINAPIQIHQGGKDDAVPLDWSDRFVSKLKELGKNVNYFTYPENDHNMRPSWDIIVSRDLDFFKNNE